MRIRGLVKSAFVAAFASQRLARCRADQETDGVVDARLERTTGYYSAALGLEPLPMRRRSRLKRDAVASRVGAFFFDSVFIDRFSKGVYATDEAAFVVASALACFKLRCCDPSRRRACDTLRSFSVSLATRSSTRFLGAAIALVMTPLIWRRRERRNLEADALAVRLMARVGEDPFAAITFLCKKRAFLSPEAKRGEAAAASLGLVTIDDRIRWIEEVIVAEHA